MYIKEPSLIMKVKQSLTIIYMNYQKAQFKDLKQG